MFSGQRHMRVYIRKEILLETCKKIVMRISDIAERERAKLRGQWVRNLYNIKIKAFTVKIWETVFVENVLGNKLEKKKKKWIQYQLGRKAMHIGVCKHTVA